MAKRRNIDYNLESLIHESIDNIRDDRAVASTLLVDLVNHIQSDKHQHKEAGQVAAKYLETLQRSNEQMVKISTLLHKKTASKDGLSESDKKELYDLIGNGENQ